MKKICLMAIALCLASCAGVPEHVEPVTDFELDRYMGKWYEIARLDHSFERDLEKVTATYSVNPDGTVRVVNRGFSTTSNEWQEATGKGKSPGDQTIGHLKVSFFGPFYGAYVIFDLDKAHYQYAFVTSSKNTLWLLARDPTVSDELKEKFLNRVEAAGYNTETLIFVNQE